MSKLNRNPVFKVVGASVVQGLLMAAAPSIAWAAAGTHDADGNNVLEVAVLYDNSGPFADLGPIYAEMLMNLLGHFPEVVATATPVEDYAGGELLTAEVSFYIGSTYDNALPAAFVDDFWATDRPVVWMGYNLWQIGWNRFDAFNLEYGFQHFSVESNTGSGAETDFFRYVQYNGKELPKFAWWNETAGSFVNDPFVNRLSIYDPALVDVKAEIVHSGTGEAIPYVIQSGNLWAVGDIPFTFTHERDRYLGFSDMVHDMIGIDHPVTRRAMMRLEDVHPNVLYTDIRTVTNVMKEGRQRPWNIAVVPYYRDPLGYYNFGTPEEFTMNSTLARNWRSQMTRAMTYGAKLVLHGYTHQFNSMANPYNGVSGDDFEFWDAVAGTPVQGDSYGYVRTRIQAANQLLAARRWEAWAWEVPHYRASTTDYTAFPDFYPTTYHRVVYYPYEADLWGNIYTFNEIWNDPQAVSDWSQAVVMPAGDRWGGQFFPYVIEHDVYGQRIIPETLGNIEPPEFALGPEYVRTVQDLLAAADANLVNRCANASFFYHPYLVQFPEIADAGGAAGLRSLVQGIEAMGYTFVQPSTLGNNGVHWVNPLTGP